MKTKQLTYSLIVPFNVKAVQHLPIILITANMSNWINNKQTKKRSNLCKIIQCPLSESMQRLLLLLCSWCLSKHQVLPLRLVSSKNTLSFPCFFPSYRWLPIRGSVPSSPGLLLLWRAIGQKELAVWPRVQDKRSELTSVSNTVPVGHGWAHQEEDSRSVRGTAQWHPLMGRLLHYNLDMFSLQLRDLQLKLKYRNYWYLSFPLFLKWLPQAW